MADKDALRRSWAETTAHLEAAKQELLQNQIRKYEENLSHNELELALDELEGAGDSVAQTRKFWKALVAAAENMQLHDRAETLRRKLYESLSRECI